MKIGLVDVDGHNFPNLPLMKISAYHKARGDEVEMIFPINNYDRVYMSKVFTFSPDFETVINASETARGGTGYSLGNYLPNEIEHIYPDYDLYKTNKAYGFLTRGCPRGCGFCIVSEKEGKSSIKVADLTEFWKGQKEIVLLDPNILACKDKIELLNQLIDSGSRIDFTQGLDIRFMTDEIVKLINKMKVKMIHFAWDNYEFDTYEKLKEFRPKLDYGRRKLGVYVLTNYNTTLEQDEERVIKLRDLDYDPYLMIYNKEEAPKVLKKMQRWVNCKWIFRSCKTFAEYI